MMKQEKLNQTQKTGVGTPKLKSFVPMPPIKPAKENARPRYITSARTEGDNMDTSKMNIHQKILHIADMAGVLRKTKEGFGYRYVPEEDIQAKVTAGLQKYGVMLYDTIVPGTLLVTPIHYEKFDPKIKSLKPVNEVIVQAECTYTWVNVDNPEERVETTWAAVGQMEDAAQAFGAGLTYGNRYYLMKQLQLATSESDPDVYRSKQKAAANYEQEAAEKEAAAALSKRVKEIGELGTRLMRAGRSKEEVMSIVAQLNDGNGNPAGIKTIECAEAVFAALSSLQNNKQKEKQG